MNGELAKEYRNISADCLKDNIRHLVEYIESQKDCITEKINMF